MPALQCTPQSVSLPIELPTVLITPTVRAPEMYFQILVTTSNLQAKTENFCNQNFKPFVLHIFNASRVSLVSPDWLTKIMTSSRKTGVFRSTKSEAFSMLTGRFASSSKICLSNGIRIFNIKIKFIIKNRFSALKNRTLSDRQASMIRSSTSYYNDSPTSPHFMHVIFQSTFWFF